MQDRSNQSVWSEDQLALMVRLRFGKVTKLLNEAGGDWTDFATDGFLAGCRIRESDADGLRQSMTAELLVRASASEALLGIKDLSIGDVVAWWPGDGRELFSESVNESVDGYLWPMPGESQIRLLPIRDSFWAQITGHQNLSAGRWEYDWVEMERMIGGFAIKSGGRSSALAMHRAINSEEAENTGIGVQGNSINVTAPEFPGGFSLQPVQGSPVVMMYEDQGTGTMLYYSFSYVNAVDGTCA